MNSQDLDSLTKQEEKADTNRSENRAQDAKGITASFSMELSTDKMQAILIVDTTTINLNVLSSSHFQEYLHGANLDKELINFSSINQIFGQINLIKSGKSGSPVIRVQIATGKTPEKGVDGYVKYYHPRDQKVVIKDDGKADFRNIDKYVAVKKGEKVATIFKGIEGKSGKDVTGAPIPPPPIEKPEVNLGKNITYEETKDPKEPDRVYVDYFAGCDGVLYNGDILMVSPELVIDSNVGLATGNIGFEGAINVKGTIEEGSKVISKGNLYVGENIETTDVFVGGDLNVKGGIKPKGKGTIKVAGSLRAKFIENVVIEVDGDIIVESAILNSTVYCLGSVVFSGQTSSVINSTITVFKGFSVYNLGSNAMVPLTIDMGVHFKNERLFNELHGRIKKSEKELSTIIPKIEQIISYMKSYKGKLNEEKRKKFKEIYEIYQKKNQNHQSMTKKYEELKTLRFNTEKVNLVVKGSAFPEAIIKYRRQTEKISKTQSSFMMSFFPGQEHAPMTAINVKRR
ncbi:MAG: DUF342 domain-containing protein [Leptospiraceae bacterium]|nr:DUF342 domain-containing protein [Leptospiraceae bacterium]MCP5497871.1 DUF342 domain-containing protein [Leptospiraceae bacterium]